MKTFTATDPEGGEHRVALNKWIVTHVVMMRTNGVWDAYRWCANVASAALTLTFLSDQGIADADVVVTEAVQ